MRERRRMLEANGHRSWLKWKPPPAQVNMALCNMVSRNIPHLKNTKKSRRTTERPEIGASNPPSKPAFPFSRSLTIHEKPGSSCSPGNTSLK